MKGNLKLIPVLNSLLADELTAINQYMVHCEMCENWGYGKLHTAIRKQAFDEMSHAEWLIERIIFLKVHRLYQNLIKSRLGKMYRKWSKMTTTMNLAQSVHTMMRFAWHEKSMIRAPWIY